MFKFRLRATLFALLMVMSGFYAQTIQAQNMEEEQQAKIDNDIRKIGLSAGYAAQCYQERNDQDSVERVGEESLSVAHIILQDFGSTLAFLFSSNAGYGAATSIDLTECDDLIKDWDDFVEKLSQQQED